MIIAYLSYLDDDQKDFSEKKDNCLFLGSSPFWNCLLGHVIHPEVELWVHGVILFLSLLEPTRAGLALFLYFPCRPTL